MANMDRISLVAVPCLMGSLALVAFGVVGACSDSNDGQPDGGTEASDGPSNRDAAPAQDASDAGSSNNDAAPSDGGQGDAATASTSLGTTGHLEVRNYFAIAHFYEDDTTLRWSDGPDCVARIHSASKPFSPSG